MSTKTAELFLQDTYNFNCQAKLLRSMPAEPPSTSWLLAFDQTVFHPQGGGQPADIGLISKEGEEVPCFEVKHVFLSKKSEEAGMIWHQGLFKDPDTTPEEKATIGATFNLTINEEHRRTAARLHSAGHLLDIAVRDIGGPTLKPSKGYHFADGPYVEYAGDIRKCFSGDEAELEHIRSTLNKHLEELLSEVSGSTGEVAVKMTQNLSEYQAATADTCEPSRPFPIRVIQIGEEPGCACGGTHVSRIRDIGKLTATKIKVKKGATRVSYIIS